MRRRGRNPDSKIYSSFDFYTDTIELLQMEESCALARMGLVPVLKLGEERPATEEDFKQHLPVRYY